MITAPETFSISRLVLRSPRMSDAPAIFSNYARDSEATRYLIWRPHKHIQETEEFVGRCVRAWGSDNDFPWAITLKDSGELIGMVGLRINGFKADLGYVIGRRWWGQGYATEAVQAIVDWAMSQPTIYRVWAMCDVDKRRIRARIGKSGYESRRSFTTQHDASERQ